jgi:uncharacterized phage protein (TIGR01671 family)
MRELKFRVWNSVENKWNGLHHNSRRMIGELCCLNGVYLIPESVSRNLVLQQYTGLKDKNGKEICEGDIIQLEGSPISYSIEWNKYQWAINAHGALGYDPDWNIQPFNHCVYERAIVVGNVFENPELLKQ